ncbi:MAG: tRNA (adenosine(37)-N6)-threonylcarbamoyltransferase complex dimerization subunit type 1 TsaB [Acidimicrobiia bacterium]|nr:tRNA (adenosine(37)-N6)-threonylcarbamoyltransferase complex dimerization subunit type 1 TsaB [Acidimicrobiia bacterium]
MGPGMFTGLRVGVTTAKVLAQALRIPVVPIPSLDLIAYPLRHSSALVVPVVDARRSEVYYAMYRPVPGGLQRVSGYELGTPADVVAELQSRRGESIVAGDGAARFREVFADLDRVELAGASYAAPSLAALVELAAGCYEREQFVPPSDVTPMYLRRSDAEIALERRGV